MGKNNNWSRTAKFFPYAYHTQYQTRLRMSAYELVFTQNRANRLKSEQVLQLTKLENVFYGVIV